MLHFNIPEGNVYYEKWIEQLTEWSAAYKLEFSKEINTPVLKGGSESIKGEEAIEAFLIKYKSIMDEWNEDRCDKWMDIV